MSQPPFFDALCCSLRRASLSQSPSSGVRDEARAADEVCGHEGAPEAEPHVLEWQG